MTKPKHIMIVGIITFLWNSGGAYDFIAVNLAIESYVSQMSAEQLAFFTGFSLWVKILWAIAVFGALFGSLLLILGSKLAERVFLVSLIAVVSMTIRNFFFGGNQELMMDLPHLVFGVIIILVGLALYLYSRAMSKKEYLT